MSFELGEKVRSRSGGPTMTVCKPRQLTVGGEPVRQVEPGKVCCEWYDEVTGKWRTRFFDQETLELCSEFKQEQKKDIGFQ